MRDKQPAAPESLSAGNSSLLLLLLLRLRALAVPVINSAGSPAAPPTLQEHADASGAAARCDEAVERVYSFEQGQDAGVDGAFGRKVGVRGRGGGDGGEDGGFLLNEGLREQGCRGHWERRPRRAESLHEKD